MSRTGGRADRIGLAKGDTYKVYWPLKIQHYADNTQYSRRNEDSGAVVRRRSYTLPGPARETDGAAQAGMGLCIEKKAAQLDAQIDIEADVCRRETELHCDDRSTVGNHRNKPRGGAGEKPCLPRHARACTHCSTQVRHVTRTSRTGALTPSSSSIRQRDECTTHNRLLLVAFEAKICNLI